MINAKLVKIDTDKLQDRIALTGQSNAGLSRLMGFADNYISGVLRRGSIATSGLRLLEACGITTDGLIIPEQVAAPVAEERQPEAVMTTGQTVTVTLSEDDWTKLYSTIVKAVKNGIKYGFEDR